MSEEQQVRRSKRQRGERPDLDLETCETRMLHPAPKRRQTKKAAGLPVVALPPAAPSEDKTQAAGQGTAPAAAAPTAPASTPAPAPAPAATAGEEAAVDPHPDPPPSPEEQRQRRSRWRAIFERKMRHHRRLRDADPLWEYHRFWKGLDGREKARRGITKEPLHQVDTAANLEGADIVLGIASVWHAYNRRGHGRRMAFVDDGQLQQARYAVDDNAAYDQDMQPAVDAPHDLLIPLVFVMDPVSPPSTPNEIQYVHQPAVVKPSTPPPPPPPPPPPSSSSSAPKSGPEEKKWTPPQPGHILLAIASSAAADRHQIAVTTYDSCPGYIPAARIARAVARVVRRTGWLGLDEFGNPRNMTHEPPLVYHPAAATAIPVPRQQTADTCGVHTILNAWVRLLGLRELRAHEPHDASDEEAFMARALEVLNLALAGQMEARTIQAFLSGCGFCELGDGGEPDDAAGWVDDVKMERMTVGMLTEVVGVAWEQSME
ncbi:MAG: hypothetical protein Q9202_007145 [Teloschistes flavicans]